MVRLKNVTISGSVSGEMWVGGLVGQVSNSSIISKSSGSGTVSGVMTVGGLVGGAFHNGIINQSFTNSVVSGNEYVGGLAGAINGLTISQSYSKGTVSGSGFAIGALVGQINSGKMERLFTTASTGRKGGLAGSFNIEELEQSHLYWNTSVYDPIPGGALLGDPMTEEQLKQKSTFREWDFTNTWYMYNGQTFPFLHWEDPIKKLEVDIDSSAIEIGKKGQLTVTAIHERDTYNGTENAEFNVTSGERLVDVSDSGVVTAKETGNAVITVTLHGEVSTIDVEVVAASKFAGGDGSEENPYIIESAEQLNAVRDDLGAHYRLGNDIDLSAYSLGQGWVPIGIDINFNPFNGTFDGNGYAIKNLMINRNHTRQDNQGLFGVLGRDGVIKDVSLEGIDISSNQGFSIGGLVGLNYGEISGVSSMVRLREDIMLVD